MMLNTDWALYLDPRSLILVGLQHSLRILRIVKLKYTALYMVVFEMVCTAGVLAVKIHQRESMDSGQSTVDSVNIEQWTKLMDLHFAFTIALNSCLSIG